MAGLGQPPLQVQPPGPKQQLGWVSLHHRSSGWGRSSGQQSAPGRALTFSVPSPGIFSKGQGHITGFRDFLFVTHNLSVTFTKSTPDKILTSSSRDLGLLRYTLCYAPSSAKEQAVTGLLPSVGQRGLGQQQGRCTE